jgi:hypothetical protein
MVSISNDSQDFFGDSNRKPIFWLRALYRDTGNGPVQFVPHPRRSM